jgi:hypothetical protein
MSSDELVIIDDVMEHGVRRIAVKHGLRVVSSFVLRGEWLVIDKSLARVLCSPTIMRATVTSSSTFEWAGRQHRSIVVYKTPDHGWTSATTGDFLGDGTSLPSVLHGRACNLVAHVDEQACRRNAQQHLDAITDAVAVRLPWDLARRISVWSLRLSSSLP